MPAARPHRLAVPALAAALALSACGETTRQRPTEHATPVAVPSVPATVFPSPTAPPSPSASQSGGSATPSPSGSGGGGNEVIALSANKFDPAELTVKKGAKVTWTAEGVHSVTSGDEKGTKDPNGPMDAPIGFTTYSVTFTKPGTYTYFCVPHVSLGMVGKIIVK